jgi:hypothetical protein
MATSRRPRRAWAIGVASASLVAVGVVVVLLLDGSPSARVATGATAPAGAGPTAQFSWLHPARAPAGWVEVTTPVSGATLFYPPRWQPIPGDPGTVTVSLRDGSGAYVGYLNATPRQGAERLHGWADFRTRRNREEGDTQVRQLAAAERLRFRDARGSCVIDDYLSKVGSHPYREIACLVTGRRNTDVFVGAALQRAWPVLGKTLQRAASAFVQH